MGFCIIFWWWYTLIPLQNFDIQIRHNVYADLEGEANLLRLFAVDGQSLRIAIEPFYKLDQLVQYLAWYYALNGINILLLIVRILKLMDF